MDSSILPFCVSYSTDRDLKRRVVIHSCLLELAQRKKLHNLRIGKVCEDQSLSGSPTTQSTTTELTRYPCGDA